MSFENLFRHKMNEALKCGDKETRAVYSEAVVALTKKAKDLRVDSLTEDQEIEVLTKLAKQIQESIDTCPKNRIEILKKLDFEKKIITSYLPKQMDESEIEKVISITLEELGIITPSMKDKGRIMKVLMPKVKGKADGKMVNKILMNKFSEG